MLEQSYDVRERLVESQHVVVGLFLKPGMESIKQSMGGLVSDDVMRKAREDRARASPERRRIEVAEQQPLAVWAVVGVPLTQRVGIDTKPPDIATVRRRPERLPWSGHSAFSPKRAPPQRN